uniref:Ig-like domain-containing protein n=1 Tax=Cyprinodon variegatus TaxID=28743 RepID=A0A3Q2DQP4_CYPVA
MFTTSLNPTETPFLAVSWEFVGNPASKPIITSLLDANITAPEYDGRITIFRSTGSLQLRNLMLSDSGKYRILVIIFTLMVTLNWNVFLFLPAEPVSDVRVLPLSTDLIEFKNSVHLSCLSSGTSLSFVWMNSSSEFTPSDRVQITNEGSTLTIINVTRYEEGPYTCFVFNPASSNISDPINVFVSYGPENVTLNVDPASQKHYEEGSDISLSCSADSRPPATFYWLLNENFLPDSGSELKFINVQKNQSGNYSCQAFNTIIKFSKHSHSLLTIVTVYHELKSVDLIEFNSPVNLSCSSSGSSLSFVWMNGTSEVTASDSVLITDGGSTLTFLNVSRYDHGTYWCHVSNPVSEEISDPVSVFISYGPENLQLKASPSREYYEEGLNVHLTCLAESRPLAKIQWFLNGDPLNETGSVLKLMNIQVNQSGNYSCHVFNSNTLKIQTSALNPYRGLSSGAITGIVLGCVIFVAVVATGAFLIAQRM